MTTITSRASGNAKKESDRKKNIAPNYCITFNIVPNHGTTIAVHLCDNCCTIRGSPNYRHSDYPDNQLLTHPLALLSAFKSEFPSAPITSSSTVQSVDFLTKQHLQNFYPQSANVVIFAPKKALLAFMHTTRL